MKTALLLLFSLFFKGVFSLSAIAQVTPDGTTSTTVTPTATGVRIENGDRNGDNLFHSFDDFSVSTGSEAFFNNASDIVNIFSRVTGGNISNIDGLIRANGTANLFLINPAGIVFGRDASLQLGGSFYGSTADSIVFNDGEFSATDLENPPLITVNAPIGLRFRDNPGEIISRASQLYVDTSDISERSIFQITIALIGGNVSFSNGFLTVPGGNIELGGLSTGGNVTIEEDGSLRFSDDAVKADVVLDSTFISASTLTDESGFVVVPVIDGQIDSQSRIAVNALNLTLSNFSGLFISSGTFIFDVFPGDTDIIFIDNPSSIEVNVTENISLQDSFISTIALGNIRSGNIEIRSRQLILNNFSSIRSSTEAEGDAGNVNIFVEDLIQLDNNSLIVADALDFIFDEEGELQDVIGNGGSIVIDTNTLQIFDNSGVFAETFGSGNGGNISIAANASLVLSNSSQISANALDLTTGDAGDVLSTGDAGNVTVITSDLNLNADSIIGALTTGQGNAGNIGIFADNVTLTNSRIAANTFSASTGNAGNLEIRTVNLRLQDNSIITSSTGGRGFAGENISIDATNSIEILNNSSISGNVLPGAAGNGSNISVATSNLRIDNNSAISANIEPNATGSGGNVRVITDNLQLNNGSNVTASTFGFGDAGNIEVFSIDSIELLQSSGILAEVLTGSTGNGGNITVSTDSLDINSLSGISVATQEQTNAGSIEIRNTNSIFLNQGFVNADTFRGSNGNLSLINFEILSLQNESLISARSRSNNPNANGGNIFIRDGFAVIASPGQNNDIIANNQVGVGGNIELDTQVLFGLEKRSLDPVTNDINASGEINFDNPQIIKLRDLDNINTEIADIESISQVCSASQLEESESSGLIIKGKGAVALEPIDILNADSLILEESIATSENLSSEYLDKFNSQNAFSVAKEENLFDVKPVAYKNNGEPIYLARGIIKQQNGAIILTPYSTGDRDRYRLSYNSLDCSR